MHLRVKTLDLLVKDLGLILTLSLRGSEPGAGECSLSLLESYAFAAPALMSRMSPSSTTVAKK